jgi:hypothetical protein
MPLESATTISQLDSSYPLPGDPTNRGDDHLKLLKAVMKNNFPGAAGNGFAIPIIATEAELNFLSGLTSNAQDQLDALGVRADNLGASLSAPAGTRMAFHQAAAPTGWTQDTSKNDYGLRVVSGAGGASGGSDSPILNNKVSTHTHAITDPGHAHSYNFRNTSQGVNGGSGTGTRETISGGTTGSSTTGISVNNNSGSDWTPKYLDVIIAVKD